MKTKILLVAISIFGLLPSVFGQGALTPPGAPAPTMKSLAQIEPRTPIATNTTPGDATDSYIISRSGSYYLTTNIVGLSNYNAIEILANNVTLDLQGFTIQGITTNPNASYNEAVYISGTLTNITVRNGHIVSWSQGIISPSAASANLSFENLHFSSCYLGTSFAACGMNILGAATVRDCTFESCYYGLALNGNNSPSASIITRSTANNNTFGFTLSGSGIISDCTASSNSFYGINLNQAQGFTVLNCICNSNLNGGISVNGSRNRIENNHVLASATAYGIQVGGLTAYTNNLIIKNSVEQGGVNNYNISGAQILGPIISNTVSGVITNSNPWANFSF